MTTTAVSPSPYADQLTYALWLTEEAYARGLTIGLKNTPDMVADALPYYDFSVLEDCFYYNWCADLLPFVKPVSLYSRSSTRTCMSTSTLHVWKQAHLV